MNIRSLYHAYRTDLLKVFRSCVTNDSVREIIKDMTKRTVNETNIIILPPFLGSVSMFV
jgi:hypothetical protein